jgi:hypothetical protein
MQAKSNTATPEKKVSSQKSESLTTFERDCKDFDSSEDTRAKQLKSILSKCTDVIVLSGTGTHLKVSNSCLKISGYGDGEMSLYPGSHGMKTIIWVSFLGSLIIHNQK